MSYPRILTVQDISCLGQCSLTVALPVISACGVETCVLPSAVLSTHTGGFSGYTFRDLTEDMPKINAHWKKEGLFFDAVYTGYLGSTQQIDYVCGLLDTVKKDTAPAIIDPAMADNGKLYVGFDDTFVEAMKTLCGRADYLLPNITEASLLTGLPYQTEYDRAYVDAVIKALGDLGAKNIILTGISYREGYTGVVVFENAEYHYYEHEKLAKGCHGTGDIFASAFTGALMRGKTAFEAAQIAADYVLACMKATAEEENHWYGVKFEPVLPYLMERVSGIQDKPYK